MRALHIVEQNPTQNFEDGDISVSKLEQAQLRLSAYITQLKETKSKTGFEAHEAVIIRLVNTVGQAALSDALSHYDVSSDVISIGEQTYRHRYNTTKEYQTAFGPVEILCRAYANRKADGDGKSVIPLELQSGIIEGYWTPNAAKNAMWALAHLTPQEVEDMLLQFGAMNPSRSSLDRLPKALNRRWEPQTVAYHEQLIADEVVPKNAVSFSISLDGVMIGMKPDKLLDGVTKSMKTEWREASCGTISFFDAEGERISTIQYGQMPEHKKVTLKTLLIKNTEAILKERPDLKLIHLADGAQDNWAFFDEEMPFGFQLTDFYHATEYLKDAFSAAYPKDTNKAKDKFEEYKVLLRDEVNGVQKVLRALRYLRSQHKGNKNIEASVTYFTNNQHRMRYAEAKAKNFPIGSGIVEASCKTLVGQRLKRAGMSWQHIGGQGVLSFRSLIKSHRFDQAWPLIANQYKKDVIIHKNLFLLTV
ncbi:hypothetical protein SC603_16295 [Legionella pneumophila serogroup 2]